MFSCRSKGWVELSVAFESAVGSDEVLVILNRVRG